jgi:RNA polymerase sigma factor (sigma-70 family)
MVDDKILVCRVLNGDMQAFTLLIRQHERLVHHMVARVVRNDEEREEICQDVFLKTYNKLGEFNFQSKLSTWIATIAYRHAINAMRKHKVVLSDIPEDEQLSISLREEETPETLMSEEDLNSYIIQLIEQLPAQYKMILTLYHLEAMTYEEIGAITGMPEGTVKNYLFRARKLLKEKVKMHIRKEDWL